MAMEADRTSAANDDEVDLAGLLAQVRASLPEPSEQPLSGRRVITASTLAEAHFRAEAETVPVTTFAGSAPVTIFPIGFRP